MELTEANLIPVLEPLCDATRQLFDKIDFFPNDFLEIDLDDSGDYFLVRARAYHKRNQYTRVEDIVIINGEERAVSPSGPSGHAAERWVKRIPERKPLTGYGMWRLGATDFTALVIFHLWPKNKIIFKSENAKLIYEFLLKRFLSQQKSSAVIAGCRIPFLDENGVQHKDSNGNPLFTFKSPVMPPDYIDHPDLPLAPYQKVAMMASLSQEGFGLFLEQGLGKTAVTVARVNYEAKKKRTGTLPGVKPGMYRVLVICPQSLRMNWQNEFTRFSIYPGKVSVLRGGMIKRHKALIDGVRPEDDCVWSVCVMSYEIVDKMWESLEKVNWDLVVLDESHYIKHHSTKRSKSVLKFTTAINPRTGLSASRNRMILTGTPITNNLMDLWAQFEFLSRGLGGFMTYNSFRSFHGIYKQTNGATPVQRLVGFSGVPLLQERLARLSFICRKDEAGLQLPSKTYMPYEVTMTPTQAEFYRKMADEMVIKIENQLIEAEDSGNKQLSVQNILTQLLRLAQITSGFVAWQGEIDPDTGEQKGGGIEQIQGGNPKVDAIIQIYKDLKDPESESYDPLAKMIIWCAFVEDIRVISERLAAEGIKHTGYHRAIVKEYRSSTAAESEQAINKDPDCEIFLGNPASAGVGLNILGYDKENPSVSDRYVSKAIYVSCNWSAVHRAQSEDRCHRRGTRMPVQMIDLMVPGTIDEEIRARVMQKRQTALLIQDVRAILDNIKSVVDFDGQNTED